MSVVTEMQVKLDMLCRQISELSMRFSLNQQVSMERAGVAQDRQAVLPEPPGSADLLYLVDLQGTPYAPPVPPLALRDGELPDGDLPQVPLKAVSHHEKLFRGGALFKLEAQAPNKIEVQHKCTEQRSESSSNKHAHGGMTVAASLLTQVEKRACEEIKETRQPLLEKQKEEALQPPAVLDAVTSPPTPAGGEGQASPLGVFGEVAVEVDAVPAAKKKEVLPHEVPADIVMGVEAGGDEDNVHHLGGFLLPPRCAVLPRSAVGGRKEPSSAQDALQTPSMFSNSKCSGVLVRSAEKVMAVAVDPVPAVEKRQMLPPGAPAEFPSGVEAATPPGEKTVPSPQGLPEVAVEVDAASILDRKGAPLPEVPAEVADGVKAASPVGEEAAPPSTVPAEMAVEVQEGSKIAQNQSKSGVPRMLSARCDPARGASDGVSGSSQVLDPIALVPLPFACNRKQDLRHALLPPAQKPVFLQVLLHITLSATKANAFAQKLYEDYRTTVCTIIDAYWRFEGFSKEQLLLESGEFLSLNSAELQQCYEEYRDDLEVRLAWVESGIENDIRMQAIMMGTPDIPSYSPDADERTGKNLKASKIVKMQDFVVQVLKRTTESLVSAMENGTLAPP